MIRFIGDTMDKVLSDGYYCSGIYLHGKIEELNECDLVRSQHKSDHNFICNLKEKTIQDVMVLIKDEEVEAILYLWRKNRGLIVLRDDEEAKQDALEKYTNEAVVI